MKTRLRVFSFLLALIMCISMFASCSKDEGKDRDEKDEKTEDVADGGNDSEDPGDEEDKDKDESVTLADPEDEPYEAIAQAYGFLAEDLVDSYLRMFAVIPGIVSDTATYTVAFDNYGIEAGLNVVVDPAKGKASGNVSFEYDSFSADADIWLGDEIVVSLPELLGDDAYGIRLSTLLEDLEDSWILDATGADSVDELLEMLMDEAGVDMSMIEETLGLFSSLEDSVDTDALEDSVEELLDYLGELDTETEKDGSSYDITTTVTGEDVAEMMVIYVDIIEAIYGGMLEQMGMDFDDLYGDLEDSMDEIRDSEGKLVLNHRIAKNGKLEGMNFTIIEEDGDESVLEISFTDDDGIGFEIVVDGDTVAELVPATGTSEGFTFTAMDGEGVLVFERSKSGELVISAEADGDVVFELNGKLDYSDDKFELTVDTVEADGDEMEIGVTVSAEAGGKVKAVPDYVNLVSMSMAKLEALILHVQDSDFVKMLTGEVSVVRSESVTEYPAV